MTELLVEAEGWLANRPLEELQLAREGVLVLGIQRKDGTYVGAPRGETVPQPGDQLVLYGRADVLNELERRRRDLVGEEGHRRAVAEQERIRRQQQEEGASAEEWPGAGSPEEGR